MEFKVAKEPSPLNRRADVQVECPAPSQRGEFILDVKRESNNLKILIKFKGKGILIKQNLLEGQSVEGRASLFKLEPLVGTVGRIKEVLPKTEGDKVTIRVSGLKEGHYQLSYTISGATSTLLTPYVKVITDQPQGGELSFTVPVFFKPGEFTLDERGRLTLKGLVNLIKVCRVKVVGYADGTPITRSRVNSNLELAKKRALSVKRFLEEWNGHSVPDNSL